jgi:hypothetical protein
MGFDVFVARIEKNLVERSLRFGGGRWLRVSLNSVTSFEGHPGVRG